MGQWNHNQHESEHNLFNEEHLARDYMNLQIASNQAKIAGRFPGNKTHKNRPTNKIWELNFL